MLERRHYYVIFEYIKQYVVIMYIFCEYVTYLQHPKYPYKKPINNYFNLINLIYFVNNPKNVKTSCYAKKIK